MNAYRTADPYRRGKLAASVPYPARLLALMLWYDWCDLCKSLWLKAWRHIAGIMVCLAVLCVAAAVAFAACGCSSTPTPKTIANGVAIAEQNALPVLVDLYKSKAKQCVRDNDNRGLADDCRKRLDAQWDPIWAGDDLLIDAYEAYRAGKLDVAGIRAPYCDLRKLVSEWFPMPDFPAPSCAAVVEPTADAGPGDGGQEGGAP